MRLVAQIDARRVEAGPCELLLDMGVHAVDHEVRRRAGPPAGLTDGTADVLVVGPDVDHESGVDIVAGGAERLDEAWSVGVPLVQDLGQRPALPLLHLAVRPRVGGHPVQASGQDVRGDTGLVGEDLAHGPVRAGGHRTLTVVGVEGAAQGAHRPLTVGPQVDGSHRGSP